MVIYGEDTTDPTLPLTEETETIKLVKNAKGIFQYEIKIREGLLTVATLDRLEELKKVMETRYG